RTDYTEQRAEDGANDLAGVIGARVRAGHQAENEYSQTEQHAQQGEEARPGHEWAVRTLEWLVNTRLPGCFAGTRWFPSRPLSLFLFRRPPFTHLVAARLHLGCFKGQDNLHRGNRPLVNLFAGLGHLDKRDSLRCRLLTRQWNLSRADHG